MGDLRHAALPVLVGVLVGTAAVFAADASPTRALAIVGFIAVAHVTLFALVIAPRRHGLGPVRSQAPIVTAWLLLALATPHRFAARSTLEAAESLGSDQMVELTYFGLVAFVSVTQIRRSTPDLGRATPPLLLFVLPAWVASSAAWSPVREYSVVRGVQIGVIALLAWATMLAIGGSRDVLRSLVSAYLRWFVRVVLALCLVGVAFGPIFVPTSGSNLDRFTWVGAHPNGAGMLLATALTIAISAPRSVLGMPGPVRALAVLGLLAAMYENQSRGALACLAGGLIVVAFVHLRRTPSRRAIALPFAGATALVLAAFAPAQISSYLLRGGDEEQLATGNGRLGLWADGFRLLETTFDWAFGLGYGVTRTVFLPGKPWAKSAHNSVLALLVSVGIVGVVLLAVLVVAAIRRAIRSGLFGDDRVGLPILGVLVVTLLNGLVSDALAEPKVGLATLYFVIALATAYRRVPAPADERPDSRPSSAAVLGTDDTVRV